MMKTLTRGVVAAALVAMSGAVSAAYKCKDANGKISYSEQPCQGAATQTKLRTDADAREEFVRQLQVLAKQDSSWDAQTIEKALGVRLAQTSSQQHMVIYGFATTPPGAPVLGSRVMLPTGESPYAAAVLELRLDPKRCVTGEMMHQVFGMTADLNSESHFSQTVNAGSYRTEVAVVIGGGIQTYGMRGSTPRSTPRCAEHMTLRQVSTSAASPGGRSSRRR